MKQAMLFFVAVLICNVLFAQADSTACINYHKGYFSYTDSMGYVVLVQRKNKYQYEKNLFTKVKKQLRITWIDDCTYQITLTITNSKAERKYKNSTTKVVIEKPDGNKGYGYSCGCPDEKEKDKGYMKKLSQKAYFELY